MNRIHKLQEEFLQAQSNFEQMELELEELENNRRRRVNSHNEVRFSELPLPAQASAKELGTLNIGSGAEGVEDFDQSNDEINAEVLKTYSEKQAARNEALFKLHAKRRQSGQYDAAGNNILQTQLNQSLHQAEDPENKKDDKGVPVSPKYRLSPSELWRRKKSILKPGGDKDEDEDDTSGSVNFGIEESFSQVAGSRLVEKTEKPVISEKRKEIERAKSEKQRHAEKVKLMNKEEFLVYADTEERLSVEGYKNYKDALKKDQRIFQDPPIKVNDNLPKSEVLEHYKESRNTYNGVVLDDKKKIRALGESRLSEQYSMPNDDVVNSHLQKTTLYEARRKNTNDNLQIKTETDSSDNNSDAVINSAVNVDKLPPADFLLSPNGAIIRAVVPDNMNEYVLKRGLFDAKSKEECEFATKEEKELERKKNEKRKFKRSFSLVGISEEERLERGPALRKGLSSSNSYTHLQGWEDRHGDTGSHSGNIELLKKGYREMNAHWGTFDKDFGKASDFANVTKKDPLLRVGEAHIHVLDMHEHPLSPRVDQHHPKNQIRTPKNIKQIPVGNSMPYFFSKSKWAHNKNAKENLENLKSAPEAIREKRNSRTSVNSQLTNSRSPSISTRNTPILGRSPNNSKLTKQPLSIDNLLLPSERKKIETTKKLKQIHDKNELELYNHVQKQEAKDKYQTRTKKHNYSAVLAKENYDIDDSDTDVEYSPGQEEKLRHAAQLHHDAYDIVVDNTEKRTTQVLLRNDALKNNIENLAEKLNVMTPVDCSFKTNSENIISSPSSILNTSKQKAKKAKSSLMTGRKSTVFFDHDSDLEDEENRRNEIDFGKNIEKEVQGKIKPIPKPIRSSQSFADIDFNDLAESMSLLDSDKIGEKYIPKMGRKTIALTKTNSLSQRNKTPLQEKLKQIKLAPTTTENEYIERKLAKNKRCRKYLKSRDLPNSGKKVEGLVQRRLTVTTLDKDQSVFGSDAERARQFFLEEAIKSKQNLNPNATEEQKQYHSESVNAAKQKLKELDSKNFSREEMLEQMEELCHMMRIKNQLQTSEGSHLFGSYDRIKSDDKSQEQKLLRAFHRDKTIHNAQLKEQHLPEFKWSKAGPVGGHSPTGAGVIQKNQRPMHYPVYMVPSKRQKLLLQLSARNLSAPPNMEKLKMRTLNPPVTQVDRGVNTRKGIIGAERVSRIRQSSIGACSHGIYFGNEKNDDDILTAALLVPKRREEDGAYCEEESNLDEFEEHLTNLYESVEFQKAGLDQDLSEAALNAKRNTTKSSKVNSASTSKMGNEQIGGDTLAGAIFAHKAKMGMKKFRKRTAQTNAAMLFTEKDPRNTETRWPGKIKRRHRKQGMPCFRNNYQFIPLQSRQVANQHVEQREKLIKLGKVNNHSLSSLNIRTEFLELTDQLNSGM